MKIMNLVK